MKRIALAMVLACSFGCAAQVADTTDETQSESESLGTTSTPGVAEWTRRPPAGVDRIATDAAGNVYFASAIKTDRRNHYGMFIYDQVVSKYSTSGSLLWRRTFMPNEVGNIKGIATDPSGNVVLVGAMQGAFDLGCGAMTATTDGNSPFIAKLSADGTCMFSRAYPMNYSDVDARSIAIDRAGNMYMSGWVFGDIDFGCGFRTKPFGTFYVVKLGAALSCYWLNTYQDPSSDESFENNTQLSDLAVDPNGNVYLVGSFRNRIDFGAGMVESQGSWFTAHGEGGSYPKRHTVGFLAKLTTNGTYAWAKQLGTDADATSVTASATRVAVAGKFRESMTLPNTSQSTTSASKDIYVVKFDSSGNDLWSRRFPGTVDQTLAGIAFDQYGYVDVAGSFKSSTTNSQSFTIGSNTWYVSGAAQRMFLAKLGNASGATTWAKAFGASSSGTITPRDVATMPNGRIVVGGAFQGSVDFGTGPVTDSTPHFLVKFYQ